MTNISNTEYVTVNQNGIFIGGKPTTRYRNQEILHPENIKNNFKKIQSAYPNIKEFRFLTSETTAKHGEYGTPVAKHGPNTWGCFEFTDGFVSPWVMIANTTGMYKGKYDMVKYELNDCFVNFCRNSNVFLQPVLGPYRDVFIQINLQNTSEALFNLNGYRVKLTVEKLAQQER